MAEPGDHDDLDDQIGFASAAALAGRTREPVAPAASEPQPLPAWAVETPVFATAAPASPVRKAFGRADARPVALPEGAVGLFAIYVLILFAVPTFGVSALLALASVMTRRPPEQDLAASHFIYQKRTLLTAAGAAVLGVLLIVINLGVFVLFTMAVWVMVRGAVGVFRLKAGQPILKPLGWWI
ncbi:hypothetical protein [Brevundimonas variabilis]|uniref:Putative membrane protein n=1 Tax=Brevundimonas variabilis TaxID=74312 RepID=A0A7W9CKR7_9CAUL|nr:hypothetical protein [Brevundimonas variabilis]MBB5747442.1 putative membrane protein [Brevundimonas variabilis]